MMPSHATGPLPGDASGNPFGGNFAHHVVFEFGPYQFCPAQQLLSRNKSPIRLGSRALELLAVLVERPGDLVTKRELMARVWQSTVVEESNLKVNMAALRRALGDGHAGRYVATVTRRGYRFVAPVKRSAPAESSYLPEATTRMTPPTKPVIDSSTTMAEDVAQSPGHHFVAIVGLADFGKALCGIAELLSSAHDMPLAGGGEAIPGVILAAFGTAPHSGDSVSLLNARRLADVLVQSLCGRPSESKAVRAN